MDVIHVIAPSRKKREQIATGVQPFIDKYITFDGNDLVVNADGLQADIKAGIEGRRAQIEGADADVVVQYLGNVFDDILTVEYQKSRDRFFVSHT